MFKTVKRLLALLLCAVLLLGLLSACGGEEAKPILPDVKELLNIDSAEEKQINGIFKAFDRAFETLANCKPFTEAAFRTYADAVSESVGGFEDIFWDDDGFVFSDTFIDRAKSQGKEDIFNDMMFQYFDARDAERNLQESCEKSDEAYAEAAVNVLNRYSILFYGEPRLTDEDLDRIG